MNDQEMLELLASDAPLPRPDHTDRVLARARRTRMNRRVTGVGAALGVVAVLAVSGTVLSRPAGQVDGTLPPLSSASPTVAVSAESQAYVAAIRAIAGERPVLYVRDGFCEVIVPMYTCRAGLPARLRDDIAAVVPGVKFVAVDVDPPLPVVSFNELRRDGEFVEIPISIVRDRLDGEGKTYRLKPTGDRWEVVGTVGGSWIA